MPFNLTVIGVWVHKPLKGFQSGSKLAKEGSAPEGCHGVLLLACYVCDKRRLYANCQPFTHGIAFCR